MAAITLKIMYKSYAGIAFHFLHCRLKKQEAGRPEMSQSTSLTLQVGVYRDRLTVEQSNLTLLNIKRLVSSRINDKFPEHGISGLVDRLVLFRFVF